MDTHLKEAVKEIADISEMLNKLREHTNTKVDRQHSYERVYQNEERDRSSGGCWDIYTGVHWIRENLTKGIVSNQDYQNLSFHEM